MLGCRQVLQSMLPEVPQADALRQGPFDQAARGVAEEDLAAVGDGGDPRGPIDGVADDVGTARRLDLTGVEADPDTNREAVRPWLGRYRPLRVGGGGDRLYRAPEDHEERVAFRAVL